MSADSDVLLVMSSLPDQAAAQQLARTLIERRLAACEAALAEKDRKLTLARDQLRDQRTRADNAHLRWVDLRTSLRAIANG